MSYCENCARLERELTAAVKERDDVLDRLRDIIGLANGDNGPRDDEWSLEDAAHAVTDLRRYYLENDAECIRLRKERDDAIAESNRRTRELEMSIGVQIKLANERDELKATIDRMKRESNMLIEGAFNASAREETLRGENVRLAWEGDSARAENARLAKEVAEMQNDQGWQELNVKVIQLEAKLATAREALESLLTASECADETGYVVDCGFVDVEAIQENAHKALAAIDGEKEGKERE